MKTLIIFGTRPEAIKLCPLVLHLQARPDEFTVRVCVTGQHRGMLDGVLDRFGVVPDFDLDVMTRNQSLTGLTSKLLGGLERVVADERPEFIIVQGDTTTTLAGALAGFYQSVPVAHVEAGLRTGDMRQPFPEEMNRIVTTRLSTLHFAPTQGACENLLSEGISRDHITVSGNTGIDALLYARDHLETGEWTGYQGPLPPKGKALILVTAHRRENIGDGMKRICEAIKQIAIRGDAEIVIPVHRNPKVRDVVEGHLAGVDGVHLVEPLDYVAFVDVMRRSTFILTDSGGVQEEAPSLGKPVLVMRNKTERQEAVAAGTACLVGTETETICEHAERLLRPGACAEAARMARHNPFGDGHACERIAKALRTYANSSEATLTETEAFRR